MKKILKIFLVIGVLMFSSCELDYLDSPNDVTVASANVDFLLNRIQVDFAGFFTNTSSRGGRVTRMYHQASDTYEISHQAVSQNGMWNNAYANMLIDIKTLKGLAEAGGFNRHLGIAKVLEAYILMTLVDTFGDVPYSQALDPTNFFPNLDPGAEVYKDAYDLLVAAKNDFAAASIGTPTDFFYANDATKWTRLSNTLELRYHLNRRLIDPAGATTAIQALVTANNFLQAGDDFVFRYGTGQNDPNSRHPFFNDQYPNGGGAYQSNYFMWHLTEGKKLSPGDNSASPDPRANYYFYRQVGVNPTIASQIRCIDEFKPAHYPIDMPWCLPGTRGYWGRDHLDPQGIPPDDLFRTLYGIYPGGLPFDDNTPGGMTVSKIGNTGAGIHPIMLAAYVDFMRAEAALTLGIGDAKTLLLNGVEHHINFVRDWSLTTNEGAKASGVTLSVPPVTDPPTLPDTLYDGRTPKFNAKRDSYVDLVDEEYDAAATTEDRLRIIAREYWIALFGNGNEAYNLYRRTGQPDDMQPGQIASFGKFPRTFFYPNDHVVLNSTEQKANHDVRVFWDNNPVPGFID